MVICVVHVVVKWIEPTPISVAYMIFSGGGGGGVKSVCHGISLFSYGGIH